MISFNTKFWSLLLKTIFNYEDIFWCRFTDHSNYTNSIGLKHGGFVYGFIWSDTKPSNKQTVLDFPGKCVYIGQTTGEEYVDKKSATLSKLYSTCAKRMQSHFNALVNGNSDEPKYKFFKEEYGYGKDVLNGQETLWLMMIPVAKKELYPNFNKISWAIALEQMLIFIYGILNKQTPLMNMQVRCKIKKDDTYSNKLSLTKNSLLQFIK